MERSKERCCPSLASTRWASLACTSGSLLILMDRRSKSLSSVRSRRQGGAMDRTTAPNKGVLMDVRVTQNLRLNQLVRSSDVAWKPLAEPGVVGVSVKVLRLDPTA